MRRIGRRSGLLRARHPERRCDGVVRRDVLRVGILGALGLTLADRFRFRAETLWSRGTTAGSGSSIR